MVRRLGGRLGELRDDIGVRRDVRVAEAEVDYVATLRPQASLQLVHCREHVRRKLVDAPELHGLEYLDR